LRKATLTSSLGSAGDWNRERSRRMWSVHYSGRNHRLWYIVWGTAEPGNCFIRGHRTLGDVII
jgi:hypothetical protein